MYLINQKTLQKSAKEQVVSSNSSFNVLKSIFLTFSAVSYLV